MATENTPTAPTTSESANSAPAPSRSAVDGQSRARAIAEAQGTLGTSTYEKLLGSGKHLWDSDEDFERFMELLREMRAKR